MTKELLQQALDALTRLSFLGNGDFPGNSEGNRIAQKAVSDIKQALAQQEQCGCREGECETKKDKTCRMTIEIAERDGIPEWTPAIGIECAISSLRDDAARLRDGSYTPLQIADDLDVIANDLAKCKPDAQQEQPASVDAYVGAREDAAIWKKRALEAEELNRKFIADVNGSTYLGEPVKQEQPAAVAYELEAVKFGNGKQLVYQKPKNLASYIKVRTLVYADADPAPTQPALSNAEVTAKGQVAFGSAWNVIGAYYHKGFRDGEAHCRGGLA